MQSDRPAWMQNILTFAITSVCQRELKVGSVRHSDGARAPRVRRVTDADADAAVVPSADTLGVALGSHRPTEGTDGRSRRALFATSQAGVTG